MSMSLNETKTKLNQIIADNIIKVDVDRAKLMLYTIGILENRSALHLPELERNYNLLKCADIYFLTESEFKDYQVVLNDALDTIEKLKTLFQ